MRFNLVRFPATGNQELGDRNGFGNGQAYRYFHLQYCSYKSAELKDKAFHHNQAVRACDPVKYASL